MRKNGKPSAGRGGRRHCLDFNSGACRRLKSANAIPFALLSFGREVVFLWFFIYTLRADDKHGKSMIPDWNLLAVLPPIKPGMAGHSPDRSPYKASFSEVVDRFAKTPPRLEILRGLLKYRAELRNRGVSTGFQWLDGSFMENKELLLSEAPKDVDVVTFFRVPNGMNEATFSPLVADLFEVDNTKGLYHVDAYP
jgi:hypothetical protein